MDSIILAQGIMEINTPSDAEFEIEMVQTSPWNLHYKIIMHVPEDEPDHCMPGGIGV